MTRIPKPILEAQAGREDLVTGILEVLDRTYAAGQPGAYQELAEFFRELDDPTLRAIAYQNGLFEQELRAEREERPAPAAE
jgi:hypothetical protein